MALDDSRIKGCDMCGSTTHVWQEHPIVGKSPHEPDVAVRDVNYDDIRDSFVIAMESAGVNRAHMQEVLRTVDDYVGNHYEEEE